MARFLNTSATNFFLEELIEGAKDRLILISPFLRINDRIKELLEDKNRLKIDVRVVYGKNELHPEEINWLKDLAFIRTSFCKNLHAKCYLRRMWITLFRGHATKSIWVTTSFSLTQRVTQPRQTIWQPLFIWKRGSPEIEAQRITYENCSGESKSSTTAMPHTELRNGPTEHLASPL